MYINRPLRVYESTGRDPELSPLFSSKAETKACSSIGVSKTSRSSSMSERWFDDIFCLFDEGSDSNREGRGGTTSCRQHGSESDDRFATL